MVLQRLRRRLQGEREGGFTLIELMVVVLIIAILIAVAIPTFLGARQRAQDRAVQSNLRNGLVAEKTFYTDNQVYTATAATLATIENSLNWQANAVPATPAVPGAVYVNVSAGAETVTIGARSASGSCFYIRDIATVPAGAPAGTVAGTMYARPAACVAPSAVAAGAWAARW